ncbi:MAG: FAD-dependent oxidoreductase [Saprospiraceae bacterium]|nr:FAD-dependent oxidoreductase [Saprospiraceae bacterium]
MQAIVIGGGIIGLSSAYYLRQKGWNVTVLEKGDLKDNCSFGNMGYLSPSHFVPLAQPGIIGQGLLWMFQEKSPFYIRPSLNPDLISWGIKFMRASNQRHVERSAKPLMDLLLLSRDLTIGWQKSGLIDMQLAHDGCMMYYQSAKKEHEELENARQAEALGLNIEIFDRDQVQALEPDVRPDVRGGVLYKDDAHLHPNSLMEQLPQVLERMGVEVMTGCQVTEFCSRNGQITSVKYRREGESSAHSLTADIVVLAAGSWSPQLAKMAGEKLSLMPGKGYSMTIAAPKQRLRYPSILLDAKVALTPWANQLRIGSTMEIGAINDRILLPRVQGILEAVPRFLPGLADDAEFKKLATEPNLASKVWYGFRPVSADGMPYIGFAKNNKNLIMATGHAMVGVSLAAGTGLVVSELAEGKSTSVSLEAFDPRRY